MSIDPNNLAGTAKVTFADEFNDLNIWNGKGGTWSTNAWYKDEWGLYKTSNGSTNAGNGEKEWYINANYAPTDAVNPWAVSGGILNITASKTDPAIAPLVNNFEYVSGQLNTWHSFWQQYGYFEISAKMPSGQGLWPAFWLLPKDGSWPPEIDVFEVLGNDPTTLYMSYHTTQVGWHEADEVRLKTPDLSKDFHRYGVDWQKDFITFYFDGAKVGQFATPADLHKPMYMITNLAVGGHWPGNPDASTIFPATLQIDYIRAYSELPLQISPATPVAPAGEVRDNLIGQPGDDVIVGGAAGETLSGGEGADRIEGEGGDDRMNGNMGADSLYGGTGEDWVLGGKDADIVHGEDGADIVHGNMGADSLWGGLDADQIRGGQDNDSLSGGDGNDWMAGDRGADTLSGGAGADTFHAFDGAGLDRIVDFSRAEGDRINLAPGSTWTLAQEGADAVIHAGEAQIVLVGVSTSSLTGDWIAVG